VNKQIQIVKSFIEDSFIPLADIIGTYNEDPFEFATSIVAQIANVQGDTVTESDIHAAMADLGGVRYTLHTKTIFWFKYTMLTRICDCATAIFWGYELNQLALDFKEWEWDINVLGDRYAIMFEAVQP